MIKRIALLVTLVLGVGVLAACDTAEERAEEHYQKGLELLEAGDVDRALVEFRNVFQLNGFHRDARYTYAQTVEERGNISEAYGQYLRLVEQYPEDLEGRRALARLALQTGNWDEVDRHVVAAKNIDPDDLLVQAIDTALIYRNAVLAEDVNGANAAAADAVTLVEADPGLMSARQVVIDNLLRRQEWSEALDTIDAALAEENENRTLHTLRLGVLEQLGREADVEAHLLAMAGQFDDDDNVHAMLIRWYISRERIADAEDYLRGRIDPTTASAEDYTALVGFLIQFQGVDAGRAEIERILAETDADPALFRSMRASLDFDTGERDQAIAEMQDILEDAEPSDLTHRIKIALANMLIQTGNPVGARALVEEVLEEDATQVAALKLKAGWLIEDDETGDAIVELRRALDQAPRDAEVMTLLARAYERAGNRDLMGEMLSLAVEVSGAGVPESLRYARLLLSEERLLPAEDVVLASLRLNPETPELLTILGSIYVRQEDWPRTQQVVDTLNRIGSEQAMGLSNELTAQLLAGQNREAELTAFLNQLADDDGSLGSIAAVVRFRLASGDIEGALNYVAEQRQAAPDNLALRFIEATVQAVQGQVDTAVATFRALVEEEPRLEQVWIALYNLYRSRGEVDEARAVLAEGLAALPEAANLNWVQASELEFEGDIEGAIAIYEQLYERDSNSPIIANNLASLISAYRDDTESLERAFTIARRLRGTEVPQFQDTYGWIAHRLGNHEEALTYLEPAVEAIPGDPLVRFHLSQVYTALERPEDARVQLETALQLIEQTGARSEIRDRAQAALDALGAEPPAPVEN